MRFRGEQVLPAKTYFWGVREPFEPAKPWWNRLKYQWLTENKRKEVQCTDFDKDVRIGNERGEEEEEEDVRGEKDESKNWTEDGGVTGQKKEREFTPHTLSDTQHMKWEGSSLGGRSRKDSETTAGEEPLSKLLDLTLLPSHRNMENRTGMATFGAWRQLEGVQKWQR